jgi:hypothetical protein
MAVKCKLMRYVVPVTCIQGSAPLWDITWHRAVIVYRRFGTMCRSHPHGSRAQVGKQTIATRRRVISQKRADLMNIAAEV